MQRTPGADSIVLHDAERTGVGIFFSANCAASRTSCEGSLSMFVRSPMYLLPLAPGAGEKRTVREIWSKSASRADKFASFARG